MNISSFSVNKPITTLMVIASVIVLGWISLQNLPLEYLPKFQSTHLWINIPYKSSSPREVEELITIPVEDMMGTIRHLKSMKSTSTPNDANITLEFEMGVDMEIVAMEVRDRIDRIKNELPSEIGKIRLRRWESSDLPVLEFTVAWKGNRSRLYDIVEDVIQRRLQRLKGVAAVNIRGMEEKELLIKLNQDKLKTHRIDPYMLRQKIIANNINVPAGTITEGGRKYTLRSLGEFQKVSDIANLPLRGGKIKLSDVADVSYDFPERKECLRLNGVEAIAIMVMKSSSANLVEVARRCKAEIEKIKDEYGDNLAIFVYRDRSQDILKSLNNLKNAGAFGAVLVVFVLYFFLRSIRSTIIIGIAIPLSALCTFALMFIARRMFDSDVTLNVVSMMGLILAVGMVVDPSIVILENIYRHRQEENLGAREAAIVGAKQVGLAVFAATVTTMCVFVPLVFMSNTRIGMWLHDFGMVICFALGASLFVALTLVPLAASRGLRGTSARSVKQTSWLLRKMTDTYESIIRATLRFRLAGILIAVLIFLSCCYLYTQIEKAWMRYTPTRQVRFALDFPRTYSIEDAQALLRRIENMLLKKETKTKLEIKNVSSWFSRRSGNLNVYLIDEDESKLTTEQIKERIRKMLPPVPGVEYKAGRMWGHGGESVGVELRIIGPNMSTLARIARQVKKRLESIEDVQDVDTGLESGNEEIRVTVNREKAHRYGLSPLRVAYGVASALSARRTSSFKTPDKEIDISLQLREEDRTNLQQLKNMDFENTRARSVTFDRVATFKRKVGPKNKTREDRESTVTVFANTNQKGKRIVENQLQAIFADLKLPPGYRIEQSKSWWESREDEKESQFGVILSVILIYMIMAALFESFVHPFTIMLSIPFAFIGVALVFYYTSTSIDGMTWIGFMLLCGLVVNNAIVLIDYINHLRTEGMARKDAIIKGGRDRLRPILTTTLTTILGLLPMVMPILIPPTLKLVDNYTPELVAKKVHECHAVAKSYFPSVFGSIEGRDRRWAPVSLALVSGLTTSSFLSLIIIPVIYSIIDDFGKWVKEVWASRGIETVVGTE